MARVFIGVGSNVEQERNIRSGVSLLRKHFSDLLISATYQNEAVGFDGDDFYNLVIAFETDKSVGDTYQLLRNIEDKHGRDRTQPHFSPRTLDLDLLLYDDLVIESELFKLPRDDVEKYAFVLRPLAEIASEMKHPVSGQTFASLWQAFDQSEQQLTLVQLDLN